MSSLNINILCNIVPPSSNISNYQQQQLVNNILSLKHLSRSNNIFDNKKNQHPKTPNKKSFNLQNISGHVVLHNVMKQIIDVYFQQTILHVFAFNRGTDKRAIIFFPPQITPFVNVIYAIW